MALEIQRLNFDPVTGDNPSEAFLKLDNNMGEISDAIGDLGNSPNSIGTRLANAETVIGGLGNASTKSVGTAAGTVAAGDDARITGSASKTYADQQLATKLPVANPTFTGMIQKTGVVNVFNYRVTNANSDNGIGGAYGEWSGNLTPGLQVDAQNPGAHYMGVRWTHWGVRHLAAIHVYEGGTTTSQVAMGFHFDTSPNRHIFYSNGSATFAGALTQNSDYRIKDDVATIDPESAASALRKARPVEYTDNRTADDPSAHRLSGYLAHEFQECFPLLVEGEKDAVEWELAYEGDTTPYPPGEEPEGWVPPTPYPVQVPKLQNVNYAGQVPYLTAGWQQHDRRIADLEEKLAAALQRIEALEAR